MATGAPAQIPWPRSTFPGANPQESAGRLINGYAEPLGEPARPTGPAAQVWRRSPGLSQHNNAPTAYAGYRGGLIVNNLAYEVWNAASATVDAGGNVTNLGNVAGTKKVSIARNQASNPDVVAVDVDNGATILSTTNAANASATVTIGGATFVSGDSISLTLTNSGVPNFPVTVTHTLGSGENATTIATALAALINANAACVAAAVTASSVAGVLTIDQNGAIGNNTTILAVVTPVGASTTATSQVTGTGNETAAVVPGSGSATITIGGTVFNAGDAVALTFANPNVATFPVKVVYTLGAGESTNSIAAGLNALINANAILAAAGLTSAVAGAVVTATQAVGNETAALNPASGTLTGGAGTPGIVFAGAPIAYNGLGVLPQPNSVCFQDGYLFFTTAKGQVYATALNSLAMNALTYITVQAKSDVTLLRGIAFSGLLLLFTTGSCEVWQDAALAAPNFPYSRLVVLEVGLAQPAAIAGWETGFSELLWVAQDFGVYWMTAGSLAPIKVSTPDLERLIEAQVRAGNLLEAGCYAFAGKKFWHISSPSWTWEFNLVTRQWNERWSLNAAGIYGRWRGTGGHPAFGKWLLGDQLSGNLLWIDNNNFTENGAVQLFRMESGPVRDFPNQQRISRADFDFDMGVGVAVANYQMTVLGAAAGTNGVVRLTVNNTAQAHANDTVNVSGVGGTVEANGTWPIKVIDANHIELVGSAYKNAYTSGGTAIDVTAQPNAVAPTVAISCSKDGGISWGNPLIRSLAVQAKTKRARASVKNMGQSGPMGTRWRVDVTGPVYTGFLGATQSTQPREVGA